jgi:hypothetical protein
MLAENRMGKFDNSELHNWYSDWHWERCDRDSWVTDIDRVWVEMGKRDPIAVMDIKTLTDFENGATFQEKLLMDWFEAHGVPCYVVGIGRDEGRAVEFRVLRWQSNQMRKMMPEEYVEWIDRRRFGL